MALCPLCNGLRKIHVNCPECGSDLDDKGKFMDFADSYSAYMDIDTLKQNDGYPQSLQKGQCPHIMNCSKCGHDEVVLVQE
ncbi:hypothetical protein ASG99_10980 [Bacillus sp. Soil768D1]|nr:hypothetical protein ASG99_10980 [Bacillus sp. Soil768D1]